MPSTLGISRSISTTSGTQRIGELDALGAVGCLADDLHVVLELKEASEAASDHLVVVDEQDPNAS